MADQPTPEQPDTPPRRGIDPGKVITKLTQQIAGHAQQVAALEVLVDDLEEAIAERDGIIEQLRAELVTATSSEPAKPAGTGGSGRR